MKRPTHDLTQLDYEKHLKERAEKERRGGYRSLRGRGFQRRKPIPRYDSDVEDT